MWKRPENQGRSPVEGWLNPIFNRTTHTHAGAKSDWWWLNCDVNHVVTRPAISSNQFCKLLCLTSDVFAKMHSGHPQNGPHQGCTWPSPKLLCTPGKASHVSLFQHVIQWTGVLKTHPKQENPQPSCVQQQARLGHLDNSTIYIYSTNNAMVQTPQRALW